MKLFHMAKKGTLKEGQIIETKVIDDIEFNNDDNKSKLLQQHFNNTFDKGVCNHGEQYFAKGGGFTYIHPVTELLLEKGRKSIDKNLPSRANAIFAIDNINNFNKLCDLMRLNINEYEIWEVECESIFKVDMFLVDTIQNLILTNQSILIASMLIDYYWKGIPLQRFIENDEPFWEYLLEPPVRVIKKHNYGQK